MLMERGISADGEYMIDPDGIGSGEQPFPVTCTMSSETGSAATKVGHDSEARTHVNNHEDRGSYSRSVTYAGSMSQLRSLVSASTRCEQFVRLDCKHVRFLDPDYAYGWWVSRDGQRINYWGGAAPGSGQCACGMNNTCASPSKGCNCDSNDLVWRFDEGYLRDSSTLPVLRMHFGDTGLEKEEAYHILGKLVCYG